MKLQCLVWYTVLQSVDMFLCVLAKCGHRLNKSARLQRDVQKNNIYIHIYILGME